MLFKLMAEPERLRLVVPMWRSLLRWGGLTAAGKLKKNPLYGQVAAVSVGIYAGAPVLDLDYAEDSEAETDLNIVMNEAGHFIEVQGTAEGHAFNDAEFSAMLGLARGGILNIIARPKRGCRNGTVVSARPQKIVMASGNAGKIREIARLLEGLGIEVIAQSEFGVEDAEETGTTFAENSLIKAQHAALKTGLPAIADDSGLSVDALDGAPGVYSARYSGPDADDASNNAKLLAAMDECDQRGAAFHCVGDFCGARARAAGREW